MAITTDEWVGVDETLLAKDLREAVETLGPRAARFLVDAYYMIQKDRIRLGNRLEAMKAEPNRLLEQFHERFLRLEKDLARALVQYAKRLARERDDVAWLMSIKGINAILTVALVSDIDIEKARTAGAIWRFAGLDPTSEWKAGQKRPWNARLKTTAWKIGKSFTIQVDGPYRALYERRKAYEQARNESGANAEGAAKKLKQFPRHAQREILAQGKLPPGQIDARARRWTVKLFLAHLHEVMWRTHFGTEPPAPYPLTHLGHKDYIPIPNWPLPPEEREKWKRRK
jgi:hypothetical protein